MGHQITSFEEFDRLLFGAGEPVADLHAVAKAFDDRGWSTPLRPNAWTPAQHVVHVTLAHMGIVRDVRDGCRAQLKGSHTQRAFWRIAGLGQVMWLDRLPSGASAPREIVPSDASPAREVALRELDLTFREFQIALRDAFARAPAYRVQHPYFGAITLRQTLVLSAVHTRHHVTLLRRALSPSPRRGQTR